MNFINIFNYKININNKENKERSILHILEIGYFFI
jgi:hypothetical protein